MNIKKIIRELAFFTGAASFVLTASALAWGQTTIAVQDFETVPATPTLSYTNTGGTISTGQNPATGNPANANLFASGARGFQVVNGTATVNFANQSLAGFTSNFVDFRLAGMSINATNGIDTADSAVLAISLDGGVTFSNEVRIVGSAANQRYDFTATGASTTTYDGDNSPTVVPTSSGAAGISTVTLNLPNSATQVQVRITLLNNDNNERWVIDDVRIRGTASGGTPSIFINDVSQNEGNAGTSTFAFTVSLSAPAPAGGVTFDIATADGTATAGVDYVANSITGQTIAAGVQTFTFNVTVNGDTDFEPNETFNVNITNVVGATAGDVLGVGTIVTDDVQPTVDLSVSSNTGSEAGMSVITVTATASAPVTGNQTVTLSLSGSATAGTDYVLSSTTITILSGQTTGTATFTVTDDSIAEVTENATLTITGTSIGLTVGATPAQTISITDNEVAVACTSVLINEININPPGTDNPFEYIEIRGFPLNCQIPADTFFVVFEAESGGSAGSADFVVPIGGQFVGTNGLLLIKSPTGGFAPPAETAVITDTQLNTSGGGIENGSNTYAIITRAAGITEGTDFDASATGDNDLELLTDATILDSVGYETAAADSVYSTAVLTQTTGTPDALTRLPGNNSPSLTSAFYNGDLSGTTNDSITYNPAAASANIPANAVITPGVNNFGPTAASSTLSGRVRNQDGRGLAYVDVTLTSGAGEVYYATTGENGRYSFADLPSGDTYIISVASKRYRFDEPSRVINLNENLTEVNFIGAGR